MSKHQLCRNCGHEVYQNYCPACGQRTNTERLDWGSMFDSVTSPIIGDEAYGLRGINMRLGFLMTWCTILRHPYTSIAEFIEGSRRKYYNPVGILLMLSTIYAIVFYLVGKEYTPLAKEGQNILLWAACSYYDYASLHPAINMLVTLPFLAMAMKTVFRKRSDFRYVEYLYIGVFLSIFEITLMLAFLGLELLVPWFRSFWAITAPMFVYTAFVFYKLFGLKKKRTAFWRTLWTDALYYVYLFAIVNTLTVGAVAIYIGFFMTEQDKTELKEGIRSEKNGWLFDAIEGAVDAFTEDDEEMPASIERTPATTGEAAE